MLLVQIIEIFLNKGIIWPILESNRLIAEAGYPIHKLTGKKGDVIIIDTSGFHRACYKENTTRRLLSLVINPNYPFLGYGEDLAGTISNKAPDFISNAIR
jgi:hypothetical protein